LQARVYVHINNKLCAGLCRLQVKVCDTGFSGDTP